MEASVKRTIQFSFLFLTCTVLGWGQAQATTGVIQGTIADPTGAAVPDARVEARNLDTNFTRSQDSDASGRFALLQMPPGRYTVTASKPGFATIVQENLELTVGQALSLTICMRISSLSEEINFAGQRGVFNNISVDGGDYNNGFFGEQVGGQRAAVDISMEAVREFQVVATGASAEFGRTAGGVVNVITKSGTNDHGSLFHYQRLRALSANTSDGK